MTRTLTPSDARQVLHDLLEALGEDADAVLTEVLADRDVRRLRVVGPLSHVNILPTRYALIGAVGTVYAGPSGRFTWELDWNAYTGERPANPARGEAPTLLAADRALCLALRELGWAPVEVPSEEQVREDAERELPRDMEYVRTPERVEGDEGRAEEGIRVEDNRITNTTRYSAPLDAQRDRWRQVLANAMMGRRPDEPVTVDELAGLEVERQEREP